MRFPFVCVSLSVGAAILPGCSSRESLSPLAVDAGSPSAMAPDAPSNGIEEYSFTTSYPGGSKVLYKSVLYTNAYWANAGQCPVESDCPSAFVAGLWRVYDPSVKHEFANYDYADLRSKYPRTPDCGERDYDLVSLRATVDENMLAGEMSRGAPEGGFTANDKEALYRETMLSCRPNLAVYEPANVRTAKAILTQAVWDSFASSTGIGDAARTYENASGAVVPWPSADQFKESARANFLSAVARYPYFCGEPGYFESTEEACKREIASLLAHASQETGNTTVEQSFYWLREYGFVNQPNGFFNTGCSKPFDCTAAWARYYGRGPKQLTYYYNYAGFSASYFGGDYNFLLKYPDLVAYDGELYFQSAIYFVMTNQPPKPSIHDIVLGRYKPSKDCKELSDCYGVQYDDETSVKNNFAITIEAVNGGVECRPTSSESFAGAARNRSRNYLKMLNQLGAKLRPEESAAAEGCAFIGAAPDTVFALPKLKAGLSTWLDMSESSCRAQSGGGAAMISVTAKGIVDACKSK